MGNLDPGSGILEFALSKEVEAYHFYMAVARRVDNERIREVFEELKGRGLPLGVLEDTEYNECGVQLSTGQIIVITTDGICESCASDGSMFGRDRLRDKIRENAARSAKEIVSALMEDFQNFIRPLPQKDDATLVVIKVEDPSS